VTDSVVVDEETVSEVPI
jgi:hypothetical protein